ncbi:MAG: dihydrolipoyl dehydrogenase [Clostridia bacterium]|nr:dihydrolipoyl dehydrogenase [Clostridia bacterium]MBQ4575265.1 dihydrolipoyl dehydrogenase [Clostridia bacterium]
MYDLIILGGGPAGYNAAENAAHGGMKTLVIEERALGGVCLNEGCIPTKTLLYSAKIYDYAKHGTDYGVSFGSAAIDHEFVVNRKDKVVKTLVGGIGAKMKHAGVDVVMEKATITGKDAEGFKVQAGDKEYTGKQLLICTGSDAAVPPIPGLREAVASGFAMTNREILDMKKVPGKLVVIGGGVIGLEMASYFNSIGVDVTVIEMLDHIAGPTDSEISKILLKNYQKKGVKFLLSAKVTSVGTDCVNYEKDGKAESAPADVVLVSIGRRARTAGIGLENIGVLTERGAIVTTDEGRTNVPGVWAAGDVNGRSMLAHTAYREGEVCINNMLGKKDKVRYNSIPSVIYTNPEVASVGETSETIKEKGLEATAQSFTLKYSGRYVAENEGGDGIVKIIIDKEHKKVLGVHMIGSYASEIIYGAAMMVEKEMRVDDVKKFVFPHPTVCEVIREGIFQL